MATIDQCFKMLKYLGNTNSYLANISPDQFNVVWPQAELRHTDALYKQYGINKEINDSLSVYLTAPTTITVDSAGKYTYPSDMLHEVSVMTSINGDIAQFQPDRLANKLSSSVDAPTAADPIYVRYATYLQFYPISIASAKLTYLKRPTPSFWAYTINGTIVTLSNRVGGTGYVSGTYLNVYLGGGSGSGMTATVVVTGGVVTAVTVTNGGVNYLTTDTLIANNSYLGGTGSGFSIRVATIVTGRPRATYDATNSVQPVLLDTDIYKVVCLILGDYGINTRDQEVMNYALTQEKLNP